MGRGIFIDLSAVNQRDFKISERQHHVAGKVYLITPGFDKHSWQRDELHLRSLIVNDQGEVLCSGFPKFRNYGEDEEDDRITRQLIAEGRVLFAEKMDGSLIIRSVINGEVCFRTRGSHELGEGNEHSFKEVLGLISEKYPKLMDPSLTDNVTMLFEYTSPDNQIILEYSEPTLTLLGVMVYNHPCKLPVFQGNELLVNDLARLFGVNAVKFHNLPFDLDEAASIVRSWSGSEGIVVWGQLDDGRVHLAKIKADEYIRLHSLKYHLLGDKIKQFCWWKKINTHEQLREEMFQLGVDWEFVSFILPDFEKYLSDKQSMTQRIEEVKSIIHKKGIHELSTPKRQAAALKRVFSERRDFNIGIQYCRGNLEYLDRMVDAYALGTPLNGLKSLRDRLSEYYGQRGF